MAINMIVACDENFGIGRENKLLAKIPSDLRQFKKLTLNSFVVQGKNTYLSIIDQTGDSLEDRTNIVLTRDYEFKTKNPDRDIVYNSVDELLMEYYELAEPNTDLNVIGGGEIYKQMLPHTDTIYMTYIYKKFEGVDTWFPQISYKDFVPVKTERNSENGFDYSFITLERKSKKKSFLKTLINKGFSS